MIRAYGIEDAPNELAWPSIFVVDRSQKVTWRWLADTFRERIAASDVVSAIAQ